ncbi:hypothetical protein RB2150_16532 [Rhodobacterales bacterium HTCC2150]|nr:hypothetical protein RB2150_16532 [Rhodobacterales bacterium HTCC2150] [Rhodobacteraceae bacterium HTCC2150]
MKYLFPVLGVLALVACAPPVPDSASGVGFEDYGSYQSRLAQAARIEADKASKARIEARVNASLLKPEAAPEVAEAVATVEVPAVVVQKPTVSAPAVNNPGISDEQNFAAVAARETIQSDAERRKEQAAQYEVAEVKTVPNRNNTLGPNIVEYALATSNPVGNKLYNRLRAFGGGNNARNCAAHGSPDIAQEAFLAAGGPRKDRKNLDPDGDGYACGWDPEPFRAAVRK